MRKKQRKPKNKLVQKSETFEFGPRNNRKTREVIVCREARKIRFDSHVHLDGPFSVNAPRHGLSTEQLSDELIAPANPLDMLAITNHNNVDKEGRQEVVDSIRGKTHKNIEILLGAELNLRFQERTFHVNVIFNDLNNDYKAPETRKISLDQLRELKENYNAVVILNHPFWRAKSKNIDQTYETITSLLETGVIDGYEMIHGYYLQNFVARRSAEKIINMEQSNRLLNICSTIRCFIDFVLNNPDKPLAAIGASDSHRPGAIGSAYTTFIGTNDTLFDSIRSGHTRATAVGEKIAILIHRCLRTMNLNKKEKSIFYKNIKLDRINYGSYTKSAKEDRRRGKTGSRKKRVRYRNKNNSKTNSRRRRNSN